jgi:hypothetical protein
MVGKWEAWRFVGIGGVWRFQIGGKRRDKLQSPEESSSQGSPQFRKQATVLGGRGGSEAPVADTASARCDPLNPQAESSMACS